MISTRLFARTASLDEGELRIVCLSRARASGVVERRTPHSESPWHVRWELLFFEMRRYAEYIKRQVEEMMETHRQREGTGMARFASSPPLSIGRQIGYSLSLEREPLERDAARRLETCVCRGQVPFSAPPSREASGPRLPRIYIYIYISLLYARGPRGSLFRHTIVAPNLGDACIPPVEKGLAIPLGARRHAAARHEERGAQGLFAPASLEFDL